MAKFLRGAASITASALLVLYLIAGAIWFAAPYGKTCPPLDTHTIVQLHDGSPVGVAVDVLLWPGDVARVTAKGKQYGISAGEVRFEEHCPRDNDELHKSAS